MESCGLTLAFLSKKPDDLDFPLSFVNTYQLRERIRARIAHTEAAIAKLESAS